MLDFSRRETFLSVELLAMDIRSRIVLYPSSIPSPVMSALEVHTSPRTRPVRFQCLSLRSMFAAGPLYPKRLIVPYLLPTTTSENADEHSRACPIPRPAFIPAAHPGTPYMYRFHCHIFFLANTWTVVWNVQHIPTITSFQGKEHHTRIMSTCKQLLAL